MARRVLLPLVVLCTGCIVPVSLQQAEQTPNYRPSFVAELCDPPLETTIVKQINGDTGASPSVQPHIVAEDPNVEDQLFVRIFRVTGANPPLNFAFDIPSMTGDPLNPTRRVGDFTAANWCALFAGGTPTTRPIEFVVMVADRPFRQPGMNMDDQVVSGGLSSRAGWRLECQ